MRPGGCCEESYGSELHGTVKRVPLVERWSGGGSSHGAWVLELDITFTIKLTKSLDTICDLVVINLCQNVAIIE